MQSQKYIFTKQEISLFKVFFYDKYLKLLDFFVDDNELSPILLTTLIRFDVDMTTL